jgi:hypothetical protein
VRSHFSLTNALTPIWIIFFAAPNWYKEYKVASQKNEAERIEHEAKQMVSSFLKEMNPKLN